VWSVPALADTVTFTTSDSSGRSGRAIFTVTGSTLTVSLKNTATAAVGDPTFVLSAVAFDIGNNTASLTPYSAKAATGSAIVDYTNLSTVYGDGLGGEWAYKSGLNGALGGHYGISSAGFGIFGPADLFDKTDGNLSGPWSPDGIQLGLMPASQTTLSTSLDNSNGRIFVRSEAIFKLTGVNFSASAIKNVNFQYGTASADANLDGGPVLGGGAVVPLPVTVWSGIALLGIVALSHVRRRHRIYE